MSVVWVTNLSAPYRRPVWRVLGERVPLFVGLLAKSEPNRRWTDELPNNVARVIARTIFVRFAGARGYLLLSTLLRGTRPCNGVILPGWESPAAWQLLLEARLRHIPTVAFYESTDSSQKYRKARLAGHDDGSSTMSMQC